MADKTKAELIKEIDELKAQLAAGGEVPQVKMTPIEMIRAALEEIQKNEHAHNVHVACVALRKADSYLSK